MSLAGILLGLVILVWSADRFVEGAASVAKYAGMQPLLIGMLIVGFGTSAPEMIVSAMSAAAGKPALALGNAYGSNITNIALILGVTSLISPVIVQSSVLKRELPVLTVITLLSAVLVLDGYITRTDAVLLLVLFAVVLYWTFMTGREKKDPFGEQMEEELAEHGMPVRTALFWTVVGLIFLVGASRLLVWGAVNVATALGVSELVIGLTIVAVGTSLPELASSVIAARKGENDIALGNIIGSNLFNTLAVVGIAGTISPVPVPSEVTNRDYPLMILVTLSLFVMGYGFRGQGRINRYEGSLLLVVWIAYTVWLVIV